MLKALPLLPTEAIRDRFYENPQCINRIGDPNVLPTPEGYFLYATHGGLNYSAWHTDSLRAWDPEKIPVMPGAPWGGTRHWAPEVIRYRGRYVMVHSCRVKDESHHALGIAFADSPRGPFVPAEKPLYDPGYSVIDASLFADDDGAVYLFFSRDNCDFRPFGIRESWSYGVQMKPDLSGFIGEPIPLSRPEADWERLSREPLWNEGPVLVKHAGRYYLYCSANYYASRDYCVCCSVADHPLGPYRKLESSVLTSALGPEGEILVGGTGHNTFFRVGGELFTSYHSLTDPIAGGGDRQLCYDRAGFHADGTPFVSGPTRAPQLIPLEELGMINVAALAQTNAPRLTDGDLCLCPLTRHRCWRGTDAALTFPEPTVTDLIMIYPGEGEKAAGELILNDEFTVPVDFAVLPDLPGRAVILHFEPRTLHSLRLKFPAEAAVAEVVIPGRCIPTAG